MAGGKGKRMKSELPKVLLEVAEKTLIDRVLDSTEKSDITTKPVVIVGYGGDKVKETVGERGTCVHQKEQLGTAHAVMQAEEILKGKATQVIVLNGDHPLVSPNMLNNLCREHESSPHVVTLATTVVPDFDGWRSAFTNFGRILRDEKGTILRNVEVKKKDDDDPLRDIKELNLNYFCFDGEWLWEAMKKITNNNDQEEYYITDLVGIAQSEDHDLGWIHVENHEALGVNTAEQLKEVEKYIKENNL